MTSPETHLCLFILKYLQRNHRHYDSDVKNCEESEILLYLQTSKVNCHLSQMLEKPGDSQVRGGGVHHSQLSKQLELPICIHPLASHPAQGLMWQTQ